MRLENGSGTIPTVMFHRSHMGKFAVGGAMLGYFHSDEAIVEHLQASPVSGGWRTRFDGGISVGPENLPCSVVAMYVEGLIHISGGEGAYDEEVEIPPSCYAVAVSRLRGNRGSREMRAYLKSPFSFGHRVHHDGVYDMMSAFDLARMGRDKRQFRDNSSRQAVRDWYSVSKASVPGRIRQVLHNTVKAVDKVVKDNFGQGKDFFEPRRPRRRRP